MVIHRCAGSAICLSSIPATPPKQRWKERSSSVKLSSYFHIQPRIPGQVSNSKPLSSMARLWSHTHKCSLQQWHFIHTSEGNKVLIFKEGKKCGTAVRYTTHMTLYTCQDEQAKPLFTITDKPHKTRDEYLA